MKWKKGRQGTGYYKAELLRGPFFDLYLLKYPEKSHLPPHVDRVNGRKHYRFNIFLRNPDKGGEFWVRKPIFHSGRFCLFRPDKSLHGVSEVVKGERYVLSFGVAV